MGSTGLLDKFLELYDDFIATPFPLSSEGETGAGGHETAVAAYFHAHGFSPLEKKVDIPLTGKQRRVRQEYVMNRRTHQPTPRLKIEVEDGLYTILQPYSSGRGSFNPAPDMYLVQISKQEVINWLGVECKSSKGALRPTWNDNLPRPYGMGNIVYFLTGEHKQSGGAGGGGDKTRNMLFTAEAFYGKTEEEIEEIPERILRIYEEARDYIDTQAGKELPDLYGRLHFGLRQKAEQKDPFDEGEITGFTALTKSFLQAHRDRIAASGPGAGPAKEALKVVAAAGAELSSNSSGNERAAKRGMAGAAAAAATAVPARNLSRKGLTKKGVGRNNRGAAVAAAAAPKSAGKSATKKAPKRRGNSNNEWSSSGNNNSSNE